MSFALTSYRVCPACRRAVPAVSEERFCLNDGYELLSCCPGCRYSVTSPYASYCPQCGTGYHERRHPENGDAP